MTARGLARASGCLLFGPFVVLYLGVSWLTRRLLAHLFDRGSAAMSIHRAHGEAWDTKGSWKALHGVWGRFAARELTDEEGEIEIAIYFSKFQWFRKGELLLRRFKLAAKCAEPPIASKFGEEAYYSREDGGMHLWLGADTPGATTQQTGWFVSLKPHEGGRWHVDRSETPLKFLLKPASASPQ